jgi:hypothetical protein
MRSKATLFKQTAISGTDPVTLQSTPSVHSAAYLRRYSTPQSIYMLCIEVAMLLDIREPRTHGMTAAKAIASVGTDSRVFCAYLGRTLDIKHVTLYRVTSSEYVTEAVNTLISCSADKLTGT